MRERGAFRPDQFRLRSNYLAHRDTTGPELVAQTGGAIDAFCDMAGSGGTVGGTSAGLKQAIPGVKCYVVEPAGAAVLAGKPIVNADHRIQGAGYSRPELANIPPDVVDGYLTVDDEAATEMDAAACPRGRDLRRLLVGSERGGGPGVAAGRLSGRHRGHDHQRLRAEIPQHRPLGVAEARMVDWPWVVAAAQLRHNGGAAVDATVAATTSHPRNKEQTP